MDSAKPLSGYTAYSYLRFSSSKQRTGQSAERQMDGAKSIAAELGANFDPSLILDDSAVSAYRAKNIVAGALGEFAKLAKAKKLPSKSLLILEHLDRFSRAGISTALPVFISILQSGVVVYSKIEHQIYYPKDADDIGKMIQALVSFAAANDFSKKLSERVSAARQKMLSKATHGELINVGSLKPFWLDWINNTYVDNHHAVTVKYIFKEYRKNKSATAIAADLQEKEVETPSHAKSWSSGMVLHILKCQSAKGYFRGKPFFNISIITPDEFDIIQGLIQQRKSIKGVKSDHVNFFRHILTCSKCGGRVNLTCNTSHGKKTHYYRCCNWTRKACEVGHQAPALDLESQVLLYLGKNPEHLIDTNKDSKSDIENLTVREKEITKEITKLISIDIDLPELKQKLTGLKLEREQITQAISLLKSKLADKKEIFIQDIQSILFDNEDHLNQEMNKFFLSMYKVLTNKEKRQALADALPHVINYIDVDMDDCSFHINLHNGQKIFGAYK